MGFIPDIEEICSKLPTARQTLLFSATMPPPIQKLAAKFLNDPRRVEVARPATANVNIEQRLVEVRRRQKKGRAQRHPSPRGIQERHRLLELERRRSASSPTSLKRSGFSVGQIQGDMDQSDRIAEFDRFKKDEITVLVASDVAARGLDVKGVSHVINFDVPWQPDDYFHRIGRTGRAGMKGIAITLATQRGRRGYRPHREADRSQDSLVRAAEVKNRLRRPRRKSQRKPKKPSRAAATQSPERTPEPKAERLPR